MKISRQDTGTPIATVTMQLHKFWMICNYTREPHWLVLDFLLDLCWPTMDLSELLSFQGGPSCVDTPLAPNFEITKFSSKSLHAPGMHIFLIFSSSSAFQHTHFLLSSWSCSTCLTSDLTHRKFQYIHWIALKFGTWDTLKQAIQVCLSLSLAQALFLLLCHFHMNHNIQNAWSSRSSTYTCQSSNSKHYHKYGSTIPKVNHIFSSNYIPLCSP